eukprot:1353767-Pyramimonas_sp.AAC.1
MDGDKMLQKGRSLAGPGQHGAPRRRGNLTARAPPAAAIAPSAAPNATLWAHPTTAARAR